MRFTRTLSTLALTVAGFGLAGFGLVNLGAGALLDAPEVEAHEAAGREARAAAREQRYALDYRHHLEIGGRAQQPTLVKGTYVVTTPLLARGGRESVVLRDLEVSGHHDAPPAEDMLGRFEIAKDTSGRLEALGFAAEAPLKARGLLGTLACALQLTLGEGDRWVVEEQDRTGLYTAEYQRRGAGEVIRRRARYSALRGPAGLDPTRAGSISTSGATRFSLDAQGIREVVVNELLSMTMVEGMAPIRVRITATLRRIEAREIAWGGAAPLPLEAPRAHGQADDVARADMERSRLKGAGPEEVLAEVMSVTSIPVGAKEEAAWRTNALLKTRALLRVSPGSAAAVAAAVEQGAGGDYRAKAVLLGALSDAGTAESHEALMRLFSADLPADTREDVAAALATIRAPTAVTMASLKDALSDSAVRSASALALGAQARSIAGADPEAAADGVAELLARYASASTAEERLVYLNALANSGAREALPILRAALTGDDPSLTQAAAYGLRFIPGSDVDELLAELLRGAPQPVKLQAIHAITFRDRALWQPRLAAARAAEPIAAVREAMDKLLARWA